jgi:hypothetical protein
MMLFQIEEPDGSPLDAAEGPGAFVGIDLSGPSGRVAIAVGGNAEELMPRDPALAGTPAEAAAPAAVLAQLRSIAERALGRPVTHVVIVAPPLDESARQALMNDAAGCGLTVSRLLDPIAATALAPASAPDLAALHGAAIAAEDDGFAAQPRDPQS